LKISREVKTGILAVLAIFLLIYGYSFLKGSNIFKTSRTFHVLYENVEGLPISAPVTINGFTIGSVKKIDFINNEGTLIVTFDLNREFEFSKKSTIRIYSTSFIGGKALAIIPDMDLTNLAKTGDTLYGEIEKGMMETVTGNLKPLEKKIFTALDGLDELLNNVNSILDDSTKDNLKDAVSSLNTTMASFKNTSATLEGLLIDNKSKLEHTFTNLEVTSENFSKFSDSLAKIDLQKLTVSLEETLGNFNSVMSKIENGEGSIGKLINDEELYNNLDGASKELEDLLRDLKENPKRYMHFSVFGKKNKEYEPSEVEKN
jgi:phospholipid/cholesterol/gamma-HCH transport system substrate-binding protein